MDNKRKGAGLNVPPIGLGCGTLGDPEQIISETQAEETLARAWAEGIRYFDTAPWYGNTKSEHRLGHFLRQKNTESYFVSTKVGRVYSRPRDLTLHAQSSFMKRWVGGLPFQLRFDYTRDGILRSYEDSLTRLGLNRVDALVIHDLDLKHHRTDEAIDTYLDQLDSGGGYAALRELKDAGEISAIGCGINHTGMVKRFCERFKIDFFIEAMPYTLMDQSALDEDLPLITDHNAKVVIGAVFASGLLAKSTLNSNDPTLQYAYQPVTEHELSKAQQISRLCQEHSVSLPAAALQFPLAHPSVVSVIPGANSPDQVRANMIDFEAPIPSELWSALKSAGLIRVDAPTTKKHPTS